MLTVTCFMMNHQFELFDRAEHLLEDKITVTDNPQEFIRMFDEIMVNWTKNVSSFQMVGISFHVGSGCMDALAFEQAIEASKKLFNFAETVGYHFNFLDIGGGFPGKNHTDIEEVKFRMNKCLTFINSVCFVVVCFNHKP